MTTEVKKFLKGIKDLTKEMLNFLMQNLMTFAVLNIVKNQDGSVSFQSVTNFHRIDDVTLTKDEQSVWDLFYDFKNPKNAINNILFAVESGKKIVDSMDNNQGNVTCKDADKYKRTRTFLQFWNKQDAKMKKAIIEIANNWLEKFHVGLNSFDYFFINGTDGVEFKEGDYVALYDSYLSMNTYSKVLQASPNGLVTGLGNGKDVFTFSAESKPTVIAKEMVPASIVEVLDKSDKLVRDEVEEHKVYILEKAIKLVARDKKAQEKEDRTVEREAKADAKAQLEKLATLEIKTQEDIDGMVATINKVVNVDNTKIHKKRVEQIQTMIREAKAKFSKAKKKAGATTKTDSTKKAETTTKTNATKTDAKKKAIK